jgi:hypothetical protein
VATDVLKFDGAESETAGCVTGPNAWLTLRRGFLSIVEEAYGTH